MLIHGVMNFPLLFLTKLNILNVTHPLPSRFADNMVAKFADLHPDCCRRPLFAPSVNKIVDQTPYQLRLFTIERFYDVTKIA